MRISEQVIRIFFILFSKRSKANAERTQSEGKTGKKNTRFCGLMLWFLALACGASMRKKEYPNTAPIAIGVCAEVGSKNLRFFMLLQLLFNLGKCNSCGRIGCNAIANNVLAWLYQACEPALRAEQLVEVGNPEGWKRPMLQTQGIGGLFGCGFVYGLLQKAWQFRSQLRPAGEPKHLQVVGLVAA